MKTLYLIRHAKSSWDEPGITDRERPLLDAGVKKTGKVIDFFRNKDITADLILSSPAVRAFETARLIAKGIGYPEEKIKLEPLIYEGFYDSILEMIFRIPDEVNSLMIFGHNPTITHLANLFLHPGIDFLPTTGVACISFKTEKWEQISAGKAKKEFLVYPRMLK